jgi:hypothetical protein
MNQILETTQLEFDKSNFLIDLVKHENGQLYVEIIQSINDSNIKHESIKINPTVLPDIIKVLQEYQMRLPSKSKPQKKYISERDQEKIVKYHLKGLPIKDLCMIFSMSKDKIEIILRNRQIAIVDNTLPKYRFWRRFRS